MPVQATNPNTNNEQKKDKSVSPEDLKDLKFPKKIDPVLQSTFTHNNVKYLDDASFVSTIKKYNAYANINPEDFKSYLKVEIDHRVVIFRPGKEMFEFNPKESKFTKLLNINVEKGIQDSVVKISDSQFNEEMRKRFSGISNERLETYESHHKHFLGKDLVLEDRKSGAFFILKNNNWEKVLQSDTVALLNNSKRDRDVLVAMRDQPNMQVNLTNSTPTQISLTLDSKSSPLHTNQVKDIKPNLLMAALRLGKGYVSDLMDGSGESPLEKAAISIIEEKYLREEHENPRQSIKTQINGLETKREYEKEGSKEYKYINDDIRCLYDVLEEFEKPLKDGMKEYKFNLKETEKAFNEKNLELLEGALNTGKINGKDVDKDLVKSMIHQYKVFESIKAGGYDTSEGGMSSYGAMMLSTINYEISTNFPKLGLGKVDTYTY